MTRLRIVLQLTAEDGRVFYVNPPHIRSVTGDEKGALVNFADGPPLKVRERPESIAADVDRWMAAVYYGERSERP
jgi:hypothetical protein